PQITASNNSRYSDKKLNCEGRACARCGLCRDWYWYPDSGRKHYIKRSDARCIGDDYVDASVDTYEGMPGDFYCHLSYVEDDQYDDLYLDLDGMDIDGVFHTGLAVDEYGHLCECRTNQY
ncbi:unnamed protein product, partial [Didymodactylos carnosus]